MTRQFLSPCSAICVLVLSMLPAGAIELPVRKAGLW
jgi:hypothetical protein